MLDKSERHRRIAAGSAAIAHVLATVTHQINTIRVTKKTRGNLKVGSIEKIKYLNEEMNSRSWL